MIELPPVYAYTIVCKQCRTGVKVSPKLMDQKIRKQQKIQCPKCDFQAI